MTVELQKGLSSYIFYMWIAPSSIQHWHTTAKHFSSFRQFSSVPYINPDTAALPVESVVGGSPPRPVGGAPPDHSQPCAANNITLHCNLCIVGLYTYKGVK